MGGLTDLEQLLARLSPELQPQAYIFCTLKGTLTDFLYLNPLASFAEKEGLTLIIPQGVADSAAIPYDRVFRQITLSVHSSLTAVGLTAVVAEKLASAGISANVVAAFYHDHIFVPADKAEDALCLLSDSLG